jgi:hypothetical protein
MIKKLLLLFLLCLEPSLALGQTAAHLYIMPLTGAGTRQSPVKPQYVTQNYNAHLFGRQGYALVAATNTAAQDAALAKQPGVIKLPDNLDQQIGGGLAAVQNALEAINIPADWLTASMTYRQAIKTVMGIFSFLQRYVAVTGVQLPVLDGKTVALSTIFGSLPAQAQQRLLDTAKSFGFNTSGLTSGSTMRQVLKAISDQWAAQQGTVTLGPIVIGSLPLWQRLFDWAAAVIEPTLAWAASFSDNFNRANANPIGGSWDGTDLQIVSNAVQGVIGGWGDSVYTGFTPTNDQQASIATVTLADSSTQAGVMLRTATGGGVGYFLVCGTGNSQIIELSSFSVIASSSSAGCNAATTVTATAVGSVLTITGSIGSPLSTTESSWTSGKCGVALYNNGDPTTAVLDDFVCQDYSAAPPPSARRKKVIMIQ